VKDLKREQFTVLDNKRPPKKLLAFEAETALPLRLGLLMDASNSVRNHFVGQQQAAVKFLEQSIRSDKDQAFVVAFNERAAIAQDYTNDASQLAKGVMAIRPGGGTALWDALYYVSRERLMPGPRDKTFVRRVIIVVSDGDDNQSHFTRKEATEMLQRAGVIVYAISTNQGKVDDRGDSDLKALADATGGRAFLFDDTRNIADALRKVAEELQSQYCITYEPDAPDANGQFRSVQIAVDDKKLKVRAQKGYFPRQ